VLVVVDGVAAAGRQRVIPGWSAVSTSAPFVASTSAIGTLFFLAIIDQLSSRITV
jgi:hypothetical protein